MEDLVGDLFKDLKDLVAEEIFNDLFIDLFNASVGDSTWFSLS